MLRNVLGAWGLLAAMTSPALADVGVSLRGSPASMVRQHQVAEAHEYTFLRTPAQVRRFVDKGYLVQLTGNADYEVADFVSYPYARPEMRLFVERLAAQHREACGEKLVVTSLTRPTARQPRNSHPLSVHPAGMAVDLRVLDNASCRSWLEGTLLSLEEQDLLDVTREQRPPHYHVAIFPSEYRSHVSAQLAEDSARAEEEAAARAAEARAAQAALAARAPAFAASTAPVERQGADRAWASLAAVPLVGLALLLGLARGRRAGRKE